MTSPTGDNSSQETFPITSTLNGRPCSSFIPPRVLACFSSASHAVQGIHSEAKRPTNRLLEIRAYETRDNIEEVDRWIDAARELERKGKDVAEWNATLGELLGKFEAVHVLIIELKATLDELHEANIYDELRTSKIKINYRLKMKEKQWLCHPVV
ncbi:hypothetical protein BOTCAL_0521g00070 [Botryotinia calthae]|uniref:Uncharacterized protein n=1 Tax=Botryotinia calthae TaxID=38488 RepID=A0A4Y8CLK1_9HELO|nr:hypothetical protein BOTCAL_0521g00070 [Botryotinia calthae]